MKNTSQSTLSIERIKLEPGVEDGWVCLCGNTPADDGFYPCDEKGNEVEPVEGWNNLYVCFKCGRIINQDNLEVLGWNRNYPPSCV